MDNILNASLLFVSFESYLTSIRNLAYILRKNKFISYSDEFHKGACDSFLSITTYTSSIYMYGSYDIETLTVYSVRQYN